jgi:nucleoside-diphosphate-sugar epimerase
LSDNDLHVVFGASGGIGSAVVHELVTLGKHVRGVTRTGGPGAPPGVEMVAADASDPGAATDACRGASVVYNCANPPYTRWPEEFPAIMRGIIEGASAAGARLVFADNLYMYGPAGVPLTEDLPLAATGRKGRTRILMTEMLLEAHNAGKVRVAIGRSSDYFGPRVTSSALGDRVFPAALAGKAAQVLGNPDAPHTYSYTPDCARALITLGERDEALGEIWHLPSPETKTTREVLEIIFQLAGKPTKVQPAPKLVLMALGLFDPLIRELKETSYQFEKPFVVDHSRFERQFGANTTPLRDALAATLEWYRKRVPAA